MTSSSPPSTPPPAGRFGEVTWTMGKAAAYLNAGGVDFGFDARAVRRMADDPRNPIHAVGHERRRWRRALASTVRAHRAALLSQAGIRDPEWPVAGADGVVGGEAGPKA